MAIISILKEIKITRKDTKALAKMIDSKEEPNQVEPTNVKIKGLDY